MSTAQKKKRKNRIRRIDRSLPGAACLFLLCFFLMFGSGCAAQGSKGAGDPAGTVLTQENESEEKTAPPPDGANSPADLAGDGQKEVSGTEKPSPAAVKETQPAVTMKEFLKGSDEPRDAWIVAFEALNVRRFCYSRATVVGKFAEGQKVTVTGPARYGFYPVSGTDAETGEEIRGYCSADYVSFLEYTGKAVQLDIVKFKQTDERWGDMKLGESRFTLAQIGCTTTCFAMCESYLTGMEITPDQMMESMVYSNEGNLYWPDNYYQDYGSDYLIKIYQKLHQGIPVLIGSNRNSGSQHWVLVTGYDPGDKEITKSSQLKASDFIINDPGSGRRNLGEFFRDLPYFIKIAYYIGE